MSKRFDELFREIVDILRLDYAGKDRMGERFDPRYYNTSVGQAWRDGTLDDLLFLRYVSQMLACIGDRRLKLTLRPSDSYAPWTPGFLTRRYGDGLYVTAVTGDGRLAVGDRITAINGGSPAAHRAAIQKNFFYADGPEREDWNGLLKMAESIDVERTDGSQERLDVLHFPRSAGQEDGSVPVFELPRGIVLDLRNIAGPDDDGLLPLLPLVCRRDTPLSELIDTELMVNYTRRNCLLKAAGLQDIEGAEDYIAELREKSGRGFLPESFDDGTVVPGRAPETVIVLTDTWTRDGAETLALAAKRAGALLIGRPTLGTIDGCGDVSYELDERFILTWPTALTRSAYDGDGVLRRGVAPDVYLPWTPEECERDVLWDAAMDYFKE